MRTSTVVVALAHVSAVLGVALGQREERKLITVLFELGKVANEAAIEVWDEQKTTLIAQSCATTLNSGPFKQDAIAFDVDEHGIGNFTLGSQSFIVSDAPELNQEASCRRVVSGEELIISCQVPFAAGGGAAAAAAPLAKRAIKDCFPKGGPLELLAVVEDLDTGAADEPLTVQFADTRSSSSTTNTSLAGGKRDTFCDT